MKNLLFIFCLTYSINTKADTTGVYQMLIDYEIKNPKIVYSQIMLESKYMKCKNCSWSCCSNPFGFFYKGEYVYFCNIYEAMEYMKTWQDSFYKGGNYYDFLDNIGYATEPTYIKRLKNVYHLLWGKK